MPPSRNRLVGFGLVGALACACALTTSVTACGEKKGGLMLAINTDMKAPKDVNVLTLSVLVNNQVKVNYQGRITPDGTVLLPATVALAEPSDPNASIRIRVVAFQERKARVLRDVRTTIPTGGRVALLRIPLNFVNDGSGTGELPVGTVIDDKPIKDTGGASDAGGGGSSSGDLGSSFGAGELNPYEIVASACPVDQTIIDGECQDDYVDSSKLPDYDENLVGRGDDPGVCFDAKRCFAGAAPVVFGEGNDTGGGEEPVPGERDASAPLVDAGADGKDFFQRSVTLDVASCAVNLNGADPSKLNLALVTPDTGECLRPNECYVPLDKGPGGWAEDGGRVQLPKFVCKLLSAKNLRLFASEGTCAAKTESNPICAETAGAAGDGGAGVIDASVAGAQRIISEPFTAAVAVTGAGELVFGGETRVGRYPLLGPGNAVAVPLPQGSPAGRQPWVITTAPGAFGVVLTAAPSPTGWVLANPGDPAQAVAVGQGPLNGGSPVEAGFVWAVGGATGGVFHSTDVAVRFSGVPTSDATAIASLANGFLYGTATGAVAGCDVELEICTSPLALDSRVDAFVPAPNAVDGVEGYVLTQDRIVHTRAAGSGTTIDVLGTRPTETAGIVDAEKHYRRGIAVSPLGRGCVFYTSKLGVEWADLGLTRSGVLVPIAQAKPALGIAVGPGGDDASGQAFVYYTIFAPDSDDGGVWRVPLPPECSATGGGAPPDGGAQDCKPAGTPCDDPGVCCSGVCTEFMCVGAP